MTKEQFRAALAGCGCTLRDGNVYYEADDLIECLEDMKLFDSVELEPCEDCIRRESVLDLLQNETLETYVSSAGREEHTIAEINVDALKSLPSVTTARKKGKWEYIQYDVNPKIGNWHCSNCRLIVNLGFEGAPYYQYCPSCGSYNGGAKE